MRAFHTRMAPGILLVLALTGCSDKTQHKAEKSTPPVVKEIRLETIRTTPLPETVELAGTVRSRTSALVSARIAGTVSLLKIREGDRVRKGQLLAQLEARESLAQAAQAVSGSDEALRAVDEAAARKKLADATFDRYQKLFSEQAVTRQEFEIKQTERDMASQALARAEARLKQAREGARAAGTMAEYTRVTAPISGIVSAKQIDLGTTVFPGQPMLTIDDEGAYQLELAVPESLAGKIRTGIPVQVSLDAAGSTGPAAIAEIVPAADPGSRTFIARIPLRQKGLKSGMFGRGIISTGSSATGISVPVAAVVTRGALTSVWAVVKDNTTRMRLVKTGKQLGSRIEILSGLADGDRIAVSGVEKLSEGARVE